MGIPHASDIKFFKKLRIMSRVIILQHDGGEMGNQLWNYVSIYAYAIEREYSCEFFSFFEYARYFNLAPKSKIINWLFFLPFCQYQKRRSAFRIKIYRLLYKVFVVYPVSFFRKDQIIYSRDGVNAVYYLPPTIAATKELAERERLSETIFFSQVSGGVFRNPIVIQTHRALLAEHFSPAPWVDERARVFIEPLRARYKTLVGVHIRQGDYATFKGGKFTISPKRIRRILDEYLVFSQKKSDEVIFVIASDGPIEEKFFQGLEIKVSKGSAGEDLFILASCDAIIGSDSTFCHFAAYYGNILHIVMKNEPIDWDYYADKNTYFQNKYFTVMSY